MKKTTIITAQVSDVGAVRNLNEDSAYVSSFAPRTKAAEPIVLAAVADGMGGHAAGEVASQLGVDTFSRIASGLAAGQVTDAPGVLQAVFEAANAAIQRQSLDDQTHYGMGTTLTAAVIRHGRLYIGHVGDSRAYLVRNGSIVQLTKDHSLVQQKLDAGLITPEEATQSDERNKLVRAVGVRPTVTPDILYEDLLENDVILLCSDGLHNSLGEADILQAVYDARNPQYLCNYLVSQAKQLDGSDNITAVCVWYGAKTRGKAAMASGATYRPQGNRTKHWPLIALLGLVMALIGFVCYMAFYHKPAPPPSSPNNGGQKTTGTPGQNTQNTKTEQSKDDKPQKTKNKAGGPLNNAQHMTANPSAKDENPANAASGGATTPKESGAANKVVDDAEGKPIPPTDKDVVVVETQPVKPEETKLAADTTLVEEGKTIENQ